MTKNPPKTRFNKKIVKLTDHTCACKNLTNFECEAQATGNGSYVNLQKLAWKNSWLIFGGFQPFGTTVSLCTVSNFELVFVHHIVRVAFHFDWHQTRWFVMDFETDSSICNLNKIGRCGWAIPNPVFRIFNQSQQVKKHPEYLVKMVAKIQNSGMGILGKQCGM